MVYPPYGHKVDLVSMSYYFVVIFVEELGFSLKLKKIEKTLDDYSSV